jgi:hypothetical protein
MGASEQSVNMKVTGKQLLLLVLVVEVAIPIAVTGVARPLTTFAAAALWLLVNLWLWRRLCREAARLIQIAYSIISAALQSCFCGAVLILLKPSVYLRVTETNFIVNRSVIETAGSAVLVIFAYTILYRLLTGGVVLAAYRLAERRRPG